MTLIGYHLIIVYSEYLLKMLKFNNRLIRLTKYNYNLQTINYANKSIVICHPTIMFNYNSKKIIDSYNFSQSEINNLNMIINSNSKYTKNVIFNFCDEIIIERNISTIIFRKKIISSYVGIGFSFIPNLIITNYDSDNTDISSGTGTVVLNRSIRLC
jgi:hypothetical protein